MKNNKMLLWFFLASSSLLACQGESDKSSSNLEVGLEFWATPEIVSVSASSYSFTPDVAVNQNGDAIVVWQEDEGGGRRPTVFFNTFLDQSGWDVPTIIDPVIDAYWSKLPNIAMNEMGDAIVGWQMGNAGSSRYRMWVKHYTVANGWKTAKSVDLATTSSTNDFILVQSDVAIDEFGNAVAVWTDENNTTKSIWANVYTLGQGWATAQRISAVGKFSNDPKVAMKSGNAIVVWRGKYITVNTYHAGVGWGSASELTISNGYSKRPQVAMSSDGSGTVIWDQEEFEAIANIPTQANPPLAIYISRFDGTSWSAVEMLNPNRNLRNSLSAQIAMDPMGNILAIWLSFEFPNGYLSASYFNKSKNQWSVPEQIIDTGNAFGIPDIAMNSNGDAVVSWETYIGIYNGIHSDVNIRRFSKDTGWGLAGRMGRSYIEDGITSVEVAINNQGTVFTVWDQENTSINFFNPPYDIFASTIK